MASSLVVRALSAIGINRTKQQLMKLGKEISHNLYDFKIREGFDVTIEQVPKRMLETESPAGYLNPRTMHRMISCYVRIREGEASGLRRKEKALIKRREALL